MNTSSLLRRFSYLHFPLDEVWPLSLRFPASLVEATVPDLPEILPNLLTLLSACNSLERLDISQMGLVSRGESPLSRIAVEQLITLSFPMLVRLSIDAFALDLNSFERLLIANVRLQEVSASHTGIRVLASSLPRPDIRVNLLLPELPPPLFVTCGLCSHRLAFSGCECLFGGPING